MVSRSVVVDPNQRVDIRTLIRQIGKKRTVLVSTHVLQEVQATCDRVLVITNGRLAADSSVSDLTRTAMGTRTFLVEAKGTGISKALPKLDGVSDVRRNPAKGRLQSYTVVGEGESDLRPDIFRLAAEKDWELYELHEERASLEEVFRSLTQEDAAESKDSGDEKDDD